MAQIGDQTVGDVDRTTGQAALDQRLAQSEPRTRQPVAADQVVPRALGRPGQSSVERRQSERAVADRAGYEDQIPRHRVRSLERPAYWNRA